MPVLKANDSITPRSVLRHRPITGESTKSGKRSSTTTATITPTVQRASRPKLRTADGQDDIAEWQHIAVDEDDKPITHPPVSTVRRTSVPGVLKPLPKTSLPGMSLAARLTKRRAHPLLYLGIGMLGMLTLWTVLIGVITWFNTTMDDIHYGRPRTFQTDQFVGHNESSGVPSHFIAINLHGHIEIIELPGGDAAHSRIYTGPQLFTEGSDLVPVTLEFRDVNGDHKLDMIINVQGSQFVFINDQGSFRPLRPEERHHVEQFLPHLGP
ncbi:MAG: hypothetical protein NVS4B7_09590 [Ktedonobacteraceae bacterium]